MKKLYKLLIWLLASIGTGHLCAEKELDLKDPFGFRFFVLPPDYKTPALNAVEAEKLKWLFLEELLVAEPQRTSKVLSDQRIASSMPLLGSIGAGYMTYSLLQKLADYTSLNGKVCKAISWWYGIMAFINCASYHASYQQVTLHQQRKIQLTSIMKVWPQIKHRLPKEVWSALDNQHARLLKNDALKYQEALDKTLAAIDAVLKTHASSAQGSGIEALEAGETL